MSNYQARVGDTAAMIELQRLTAFANGPNGGNPAGVWIGTNLPSDEEMLNIAAEVGYSETVFAAASGSGGYDVKYFSPQAEVPFCGHATIALGGRLGQDVGPGTYKLETKAGTVPVTVSSDHGQVKVTLVSVEPSTAAVPSELLDAALASLSWTRDDLDDSMSPAVAAAGARHLLLPVVDRARLASVTYDFDALRSRMIAEDLTTVDLVWRESLHVFHSRNLFPVGGVVEDPATGAAAAALGGHLRLAGIIEPPATLEIHQGVDMGRPSLLHVAIPVTGGIEVSGTATAITSAD